jgi:hypothetical protein
VPHGREEDGDPGLVRPDVGRFLGHLGHPDGVAVAVKPVEGGALWVELVAEHKYETAVHGRSAKGLCGLIAGVAGGGFGLRLPAARHRRDGDECP